MKRSLRYIMFALLYFAQGSIMAFFTALNGIYLQTFGHGMGEIGLIGTIAMIPFVIKIFLGMLSDKVNLLGFGHRKPFIVLGLLIQAFFLIIIPISNAGGNFTLYASLAFVIMMGMALYDTCTDGLALDTTPEDEEGIIQGFMVGGRAAGMVLTSALLGGAVENFSWLVGFILLAVVTLLPLPLVLIAKESEKEAISRFEWSAFKVFTRSHVIALGVLGALYSLIINGALQLVNPYLSHKFTLSYTAAGFVATVVGLGTILGGLVGGRITDQIGQKRSVQAAIVITILGVGGLAAISAPWMAWVLVFVFGFAFGFYETIYFAISMRVTDGRIAATMFSILMAVANIGTGIGLGLSGAMAEGFGFVAAFLAIAAMNLFALPLIRTIFKNTHTMEKIA